MSKSVRFLGLFFLVALASPSIQSAVALRKFPDSIFLADRSAAACWIAINVVDGCQDEIDMAMKSNEIEVSYECCSVILHGLPPKCAAVVFSSGGEFMAEISGAVHEYCDGMGITPPVLESEMEDKVEEN